MFVDELLARERMVYWLGGIGGTVLLLVAAVCWWQVTSVNPKRVLQGTIAGSLSTQSVTLQSAQSSSSTTTQQYLQLSFGPTPTAHSLTVLNQGASRVETENLSTPTGDYTRYTGIKTAKKDKQGRPVNLGGILGVWAKTGNGETKGATTPQLFSQVLTSLSLPFGNLPASARTTLLQEIQDDSLYQTNYQQVKKQHVHGRLQYVYTVKIQPILYVRFMKNYSKQMDLHALDSIDPNTYSGAQAISVKWTVDAHARQLVGVDYGNGHQETYSGYGLPVRVTAPAHPISAAQLQSRLSALQ